MPEPVTPEPAIVAEAPVAAPAKGKGKGKKKGKGQTEEIAAANLAVDINVPPISMPTLAPRAEETVGLPPTSPDFSSQPPAVAEQLGALFAEPAAAQPAYSLDFFDPASVPQTAQPVYQPQPQEQAGQMPGQTGALESPYQAPSVPIPSPTFKPVIPTGPAHPQAFAQPTESAQPVPMAQPEVPAQPVLPLTPAQTLAQEQPAMPPQSQPVIQPIPQAVPPQQSAPPEEYDVLADLIPDYQPQAYGQRSSEAPAISALPPQPVASDAVPAADARQAFWKTVNSAIKSDPRQVAGGGVPQGVSAPIPAYFPQPQAAPARVPSGTACPGCSEYLEPGSRFCGECGYRLEARISACHLCGAPQEPGAKFCGECGSKAAPEVIAQGNAPGQGEPVQFGAPQVPTAAMTEEARQYESYLSGQKPTQQAWVTKLKKILD